MTEPTDAELDAVLCSQWPAFSMQATLVRMWVRAAMRDALAKWGTPPAVAGEPVGWLHLHPDEPKGDLCGYRLATADLRAGWTEVPVYTAPQAGAVPLTEAQREAIWQECRYDNGEGWEVDCWEVIDAVERMLGIK